MFSKYFFMFLEKSKCVQYTCFKIFAVDVFWKTNQLNTLPTGLLFLFCQTLLNLNFSFHKSVSAIPFSPHVQFTSYFTYFFLQLLDAVFEGYFIMSVEVNFLDYFYLLHCEFLFVCLSCVVLYQVLRDSWVN